jgi:hypothetical protein
LSSKSSSFVAELTLKKFTPRAAQNSRSFWMKFCTVC